MYQCLTPAFGGSNSDVQIVLNPGLPDKVIKTPWPQVGIEWYILSTGFTRYNASYFNLTPFTPLDCLTGLEPLLMAGICVRLLLGLDNHLNGIPGLGDELKAQSCLRQS